MAVGVVVLVVLFLFKVVHVELSDERGKVVVFEVAWEDLLSEFSGFFDYQSCAVRRPAD